MVQKPQKFQVCWVPVHLHHRHWVTIQGSEHRYPWEEEEEAAMPACQWERLKEGWSGWRLGGWKQGVGVVMVVVVTMVSLKGRGQRKQGKRWC